VSSLNPALEDLRFCPRCGAEPRIDFPRSLTCASCGYGAFYNPKPIALAIPADADGRIVLMRRALEPGRGRWSLPGGFVDLGESVEQAAVRECAEEIAAGVELCGLIGVYSRPEDRIVAVVFAARTLGDSSPTEEALEVRAFAPTEIPWAELAFWSDEPALREYLSRTGRPVAVAGS
jgi:ADP-ribose pyrophosphatase YjhB (NUDIX family)